MFYFLSHFLLIHYLLYYQQLVVSDHLSRPETGREFSPMIHAGARLQESTGAWLVRNVRMSHAGGSG
jgi:hypothetical protein